jgi:hypothetical protein
VQKTAIRSSPREILEMLTWFYHPFEAKRKPPTRSISGDLRSYIILRDDHRQHTNAAMLFVDTVRLFEEWAQRNDSREPPERPHGPRGSVSEGVVRCARLACQRMTTGMGRTTARTASSVDNVVSILHAPPILIP